MLFLGELLLGEIGKMLDVDNPVKDYYEERERIARDSRKRIEEIRQQSQIEMATLDLIHKARMEMLDSVSDSDIDFELRKWLISVYPVVRNDKRVILIMDAVHAGYPLHELKKLV